MWVWFDDLWPEPTPTFTEEMSQATPEALEVEVNGVMTLVRFARIMDAFVNVDTGATFLIARYAEDTKKAAPVAGAGAFRVFYRSPTQPTFSATTVGTTGSMVSAWDQAEYASGAPFRRLSAIRKRLKAMLHAEHSGNFPLE